ncbi:TetR/AcrR family transcriptional regulator [Leifsonia sp. AG29]|uniref:TetR/AcrR family transcriptional regulator n=1 Tax=Leifsonia sp. AG29 TaxID=2598860 RepID=UPI0018EF3226|nr:TetR/AcrR family transcriptional regulator [Leifsonia sp. AG29]
MSADTRDLLIESTRELMWDRGYAAMSPRAILVASGVGQGSMYHHFSGKEQLAAAAIERNAEQMRAQVADDLAGPGTAVERIGRYLHREREVLKGCRFGKLAQDPDVDASDVLHGSVDEMFAWLQDALATVVREGQEAGELPAGLDAARIAATIAATLQGGYVLARAAQDGGAFHDAVDGLLDLLAASSGGA